VNAQHDEHGEAVTETVILVPVLLLLVTVVIQFGLWYHAQHVVQAAAQEGARGARAYGATPDDGVERASAFLRRAAGASVQAIDVTTESTADRVSVWVRGEAPAVLPGLRLQVGAVATSPLERFSTP
jgi:Flp pilus assembly protein TadG